MAQDHDVIASGLALVGRERAAKLRLNLEHREEPRLGDGGTNRLRPVTAQTEGAASDHCHGVEHRILLAPIQVVCGRYCKRSDPRKALRRRNVKYSDNRIGLWKRKRLQQESVYDATNRRVRADAECKNRQSGQSEARALAQTSDTVDKLLSKSVHRCSWPKA